MTIETTDAATRHPRAGRPAPGERPVRGERPARDVRPPRPAAKPNGQWKVDGTAPLNGNEEWKQVDDGLSVRERIEQVYSKGGFAADGETLGEARGSGTFVTKRPVTLRHGSSQYAALRHTLDTRSGRGSRRAASGCRRHRPHRR